MRSEQDRGDGKSLRGFIGEIGWAWRLLIGALALLVVWRIARTELLGTVRDYRAASQDGTVRETIRAARSDLREATGENEEVTRLNARVTTLQQQLTAEQTAHRTDLERTTAAEGRAAACELRLTQMGVPVAQ